MLLGILCSNSFTAFNFCSVLGHHLISLLNQSWEPTAYNDFLNFNYHRELVNSVTKPYSNLLF